MKIAHVVSTFPPYHGGMGNSVAGMATALAARGHAVTVLTPRKKRIENSDYPFSIIYSHPWGRFGNAAFLPQLLWNLQGYDIVHLHVPFFGGAEFVAFWKQFALWPKPSPLVVTYHMDAVADGWKGRLFAWHNRHILPWILRSADRIIATSSDYAEHSLLANLHDIRSKIVSIPLGIDIRRFIAHSDLQHGGVLFVGGLDRAHAFKGLDVLLRAMKLVNDFTEVNLVVVGNGDLRASYEALAKELGIADRVTFAGSVADDVLPRYYSNATCVVLPSMNASEAFGMVLLEAMAAARAVVASNLPGVRSVVVDGSTGVLVKPGDIVGLAKVITELVQDPEYARKLGQAGRRRVEKEYTLERVGEMLEKLYKGLL